MTPWAVFILGLLGVEQQSCPMSEADALAEALECNLYASKGVRYEARRLP